MGGQLGTPLYDISGWSRSNMIASNKMLSASAKLGASMLFNTRQPSTNNLGGCQKPDIWETKNKGPTVNPTPLALPSVSRYFPPAVAKTYVVTFRSHDDDRPSKFIVLADNMKSAINKAWEHGEADFASTNPPDKLMICVIFYFADCDFPFSGPTQEADQIICQRPPYRYPRVQMVEYRLNFA